MVKVFGAGAQHFNAPEEIAAKLLPKLASDTKVLIKGSRFMKMERVVDLLIVNNKVANT
jgi:UDP-N-acetylmuramyl pentapeptide synthase